MNPLHPGLPNTIGWYIYIHIYIYIYMAASILLLYPIGAPPRGIFKRSQNRMCHSVLVMWPLVGSEGDQAEAPQISQERSHKIIRNLADPCWSEVARTPSTMCLKQTALGSPWTSRKKPAPNKTKEFSKAQPWPIKMSLENFSTDVRSEIEVKMEPKNRQGCLEGQMATRLQFQITSEIELSQKRTFQVFEKAGVFVTFWIRTI